MIAEETKKRHIGTIDKDDSYKISPSKKDHNISNKRVKLDNTIEKEVDPLEPDFADISRVIMTEEKSSQDKEIQPSSSTDDISIVDKDQNSTGSKRNSVSVEFISKRNNYSDDITEYNIEKNINEDKYRRRNSIIEGEDKLINQWHKLQKIAFEKTGDAKIYKPGDDPRDFNVLWRGYVKVLNKACKKVKTSGEKKDNDIDGEVEIENKIVKEPGLQEDPELELFDEMTTEEKIMKLNIFLRSEIYFCCYCGVRYKNEQELYEHCPGIKQEDHE
ncbi:similar to Saccharomyces cerevisiae YLR271W Putative protein of unknown function [Maudiozyma saulgeensis]|uniref:DUF4187 domain-containing protein n=1 Tax=Maudiozyma saulgeensis TaxID=1789683 RepID=A0A1X7R6K2_9SACH|nr:similar to Saccharomyces cerevisiae YLR271W Putative protein of unknown function [Kazachstania saulgeensis]